MITALQAGTAHCPNSAAGLGLFQGAEPRLHLPDSHANNTESKHSRGEAPPLGPTPLDRHRLVTVTRQNYWCQKLRQRFFPGPSAVIWVSSPVENQCLTHGTETENEGQFRACASRFTV